VDLFRVEHGRVVEHWDVDEPISAASANRNSPI
jgi:predicted SnoaL-like aldol condensation-catalyzing enzyme